MEVRWYRQGAGEKWSTTCADAGSLRSFTAIRKDAGLYCGSRLRKGEVFAYVGLPHNLKDLKEERLLACESRAAMLDSLR